MANEKVFDHRAENYAKARPGYAPEVHELFFKLFPAPGAAADIGCGTGIFAKPLLERGLRVFGVEPNGEMREKAVKALSGFPDFIPVAAPAEATTLPDNSVSAVTMGSALHWFDPDAFGKECRRILTPGGLFFAVINARDYEDPFTKAQHALCERFCPGFSSLRHGLLPGVPPGKRGVSGGWRKRRNASAQAPRKKDRFCKKSRIRTKNDRFVQNGTLDGFLKIVIP